MARRRRLGSALFLGRRQGGAHEHAIDKLKTVAFLSVHSSV
jgi:hypothetical protein